MRHGKGKALKRIGGVVLALACTVALSLGAIGLVGCSGSGGSGGSSEETWTFTDSLGRQVELPKNLERICPSGHTAQQVLLTMAPDKMVGLSQPLNDDQLKIFGDKFKDYPVFGAVLGAKDDFNREAVAAAKPQVIIDTGEVKKDTKESLDALQEQLGIPVRVIPAALEQVIVDEDDHAAQPREEQHLALAFDIFTRPVRHGRSAVALTQPLHEASSKQMITM